jgi:hypothetical protein
VSVGFIVGALPKYQMSEHFTSQVQKVLAGKPHIPARKVHIKCNLTRVSTVHRGLPIRCQAFDVQLQRKDVKKYVGKLCDAFPETSPPQRLMLYRDRHVHPSQFAAAIKCKLSTRMGIKSLRSMVFPKWRCFALRRSSRKNSHQSSRSYRPTPQTEQALPGSL